MTREEVVAFFQTAGIELIWLTDVEEEAAAWPACTLDNEFLRFHPRWGDYDLPLWKEDDDGALHL